MQRNIVKRLSVWALIVAAVLMIPLVAQWPWTGGDFVFGVVMLFGSAVIFELITRKMESKQQRIIVGAIVFVILAALWVLAATG